MENAKRVRRDFGLTDHKMISIVGSGGKTALMLWLGGMARGETNIIMTTTTKMMRPPADTHDRAYAAVVDLKEAVAHGEVLQEGTKPQTILVHEGLSPTIEDKLHGIDAKGAAYLASLPATTLIEADGARKLPLKWWKKTEPVVPKETQVTIGVIPIDLVGAKVDETNFYHLAGYVKKTGHTPDLINIDLLVDIICHQDGLFKGACGDRVLVLSRCEDEKSALNAEEVVDRVRQRGVIDRAFALSVKEMQDENYSHYTCCW